MTGTQASVSVVIPTRDRPRLLDEALRSVREQSLAVAHVIVVDDGSADETAAVAERAGVTLLRTTGGTGPAAARNLALEHVETDLVTFLDDDDLLWPHGLGLLMAALHRDRSAPFAWGQALWAARGPAGWEPGSLVATRADELEDVLCSLYVRNSVPASGALVRTEAARSVGGYPTGLEFSEDHLFWLHLAMRAQPAHVPELVSIYRRHLSNRHAPLVASRAEEAIGGLAGEDSRLAACLARRRGVQLCELTVETVKRGRPSALIRVLRAARRDRSLTPETLRAGVRHWRVRRQGRGELRRTWDARADVRDWLATY